MNTNPDNNTPDPSLSGVLNKTAVFTLLSYVIYGIIKRFTDNEVLFLIPLLLFTANFLFLAVMIYKVKSKKIKAGARQWRGLLIQAVINLCFVILMGSYL